MTIFYTRGPAESEAFIRTALRLSGMRVPAVLSVNEHGKPYCENGGPFFNLTNTDGLTAVAVGEREMGIDAERDRERRADAVKKRLDPEERNESFPTVWTAKEAYAKFLGVGVFSLLPSLRFHHETLFRDGTPLSVFLRHISLAGCTLCICAAEPEKIAFTELYTS